MDRTQAIIALLDKWRQDELLVRMEALRVLGVTRLELIDARKLAAQAEANSLRAAAAAREATIPDITDDVP